MTTTYDGTTYRLAQLHFHTPSEHHVRGTFFPMELHLVHVAVDTEVANATAVANTATTPDEQQQQQQPPKQPGLMVIAVLMNLTTSHRGSQFIGELYKQVRARAFGREPR